MIELRIEQIEDKREKGRVARRILEALPAWFAIPQAREQYISDSENQLFLAARRGEEAAGFLCLKETGRDTAEIAVMGVAPPVPETGNRPGTGVGGPKSRPPAGIFLFAGQNRPNGTVSKL